MFVKLVLAVWFALAASGVMAQDTPQPPNPPPQGRAPQAPCPPQGNAPQPPNAPQGNAPQPPNAPQGNAPQPPNAPQGNAPQQPPRPPQGNAPQQPPRPPQGDAPQPPCPPQGNMGGAGSTLEDHNIYIATSADGLMWEFDNVPLREAASVPTLVYWHDTLWIYFVNGRSGDDYERLTAMWQDETGAWQEQPITLEFDGRPVDPEALVLEDGRLRLYFFDFSVLGQPHPQQAGADDEALPSGKIYSAVSEDGLHFTLEEGVRLETKPPATDPSVVRLAEDNWLMYVTAGLDTLRIAQSEDGLHFETVGESANGNIAGTVQLEDGRLRQYACTMRGEMIIQESTDGLTWELLPEESYSLPRGCDPSLTRVGAVWYMVYKQVSVQNAPAPPAGSGGG